MGHGFHLRSHLGGVVQVAFIVDVFAHKIIAWHAATSKDVNLVMTPRRIATWPTGPPGAQPSQENNAGTPAASLQAQRTPPRRVMD